MKINEEVAKYYYTASEARKALGIDEQAFQYWKRTGRIKATTFPGRKQSLYSKKEIHSLITSIEATLLAEGMGGYEYRKANYNELEEGYELAYLIFGKGAYPLEVRQKFMKINPDIFYHLYDDKKLVALFNIIPFKHDAILRFINGETRIKDISDTELETFRPGIPLECIIVEMITTPTVPPAMRSHYGSRLLAGVGKTLHECAENSIEIAKLYGTSSTPTGLHILKTAEFKLIKSLPEGRHAFELDVQKSNIKFLRDYKETLQARKNR